jgi:hypothetical protein
MLNRKLSCSLSLPVISYSFQMKLQVAILSRQCLLLLEKKIDHNFNFNFKVGTLFLSCRDNSSMDKTCKLSYSSTV